jgi:hypothetical protein
MQGLPVGGAFVTPQQISNGVTFHDNINRLKRCSNRGVFTHTAAVAHGIAMDVCMPPIPPSMVDVAAIVTLASI